MAYKLSLGFGTGPTAKTSDYDLPDQQAVSKVTHALRGALHDMHGQAIAKGDNSPIPTGPVVPVSWSVTGNGVTLTGHQDIPVPNAAAQATIEGLLFGVVAQAEKVHGHVGVHKH